MEIKDAIILVCNKRNVDPATVLKRGKPSMEARLIRAEAERLISGQESIIEAKRPVKETPNPLRQAKPQTINPNAKPTFTEKDQEEFDVWWNSLSENLQRFFVRK